MKTWLYVQTSVYKESRKREDVQYENNGIYKPARQKKAAKRMIKNVPQNRVSEITKEIQVF